jgi:hypothetical protein
MSNRLRLLLLNLATKLGIWKGKALVDEIMIDVVAVRGQVTAPTMA